jgi:uncharacterized integral membrane protein
MTTTETRPEIYQGQFGQFEINEGDRQGVIVYRGGLVLAALSFTLSSLLILLIESKEIILPLLTPLFALFAVGLGISLLTIHIYFIPLHRVLKVFWLIGVISAIVLANQSQDPLALFVYNQPLTLLGIGFIFAALTGIYFKEAFCFNRLETKFLTPLVPFLLLGHLMGMLPVIAEQILLVIWTVLFMIFAVRKVIQPITPDIGDKSVFAYLKQK